MKSGFSTLELIMVMTVSSIIMTSLLDIYNQVSRNMIRVERFIFEDTQLMTLRNRFQKDLSGLSAIWFKEADLQDGSEQKKSSSDRTQSSQYFYSVNKNGNLETLTFVTTNPLQSYGFTQSRFVRVVYRVQPDPAHEGALRLMRKEVIMPHENIDETVLQGGKFYELVGGISSLEMTYEFIDKIEIEKQLAVSKNTQTSGATDAQKKEEKQSIIRSVKQWKQPAKNKAGSGQSKHAISSSEDESEQSNQDEEDLGGAVVPKFIEMKIIFGENYKQLNKEYKLEFYIPSSIDNLPRALSKASSSGSTTIKEGGVKI